MKFPHLDSLIHPVVGLAPKSNVTTNDEDGPNIDLGGASPLGQFHSGVVLCYVGAATGTPTSFSVVFTLEDSADGTTFAAVSGKTVTMTAAGVETIDFFPNELKEYIRVNRVVTTTGGSTPGIPNGATVLLGAGREVPYSA